MWCGDVDLVVWFNSCGVIGCVVVVWWCCCNVELVLWCHWWWWSCDVELDVVWLCGFVIVMVWWSCDVEY